MLSIVAAAVFAFQPHPIGYNYYLGGNEPQIIMTVFISERRLSRSFVIMTIFHKR